jgi:hypothetical protein
MCYKFLIFNHTALFILASSIKTLTFFYYFIRHAKTLKNLRAQAKAVSVSRFIKSSD